MRKLHIRPFIATDTIMLDKVRWTYQQADLEVPKGYETAGVRTVVAEKLKEDGERQFVAALTGTLAIILDPFIKNPEADRLDVMEALIKLEAVVSYVGQTGGAVDSYIAVPDVLPEYQVLVTKYGYEKTVENCTVFRRPLLPDTQPLIGTVRDAVEAGAVNMVK